jgi:recombination protein RecA
MTPFASTDPSAATSRQVPVVDLQSDLGSKPHPIEKQAAWCLATFAGRLSELSGDSAGAPLSLVFRLVLEAQQKDEPVAWITSRQSTFFPPDAADNGVDLDALAVIQTRDILTTARAAEHLLRSSAFGLLVLDLGSDSRLPLHAQSRLAGQARCHETALVCLTEKQKRRDSLSPLVSLRAHTRAIERQGQRFRCQAGILKDKHRGPGWSHVEVCRGPDGLH